MKRKKQRIRLYSALEVANMCGVVNQTAINWIRRGTIKAFMTPGGQYRVYPSDLVQFLRDNSMKIPEELRPYVVLGSQQASEKKSNFSLSVILLTDRDEFIFRMKQALDERYQDCTLLTASSLKRTMQLIAEHDPQFVFADAESLSEDFTGVLEEYIAQMKEGGRLSSSELILFSRIEDVSLMIDQYYNAA